MYGLIKNFTLKTMKNYNEAKRLWEKYSDYIISKPNDQNAGLLVNKFAEDGVRIKIFHRHDEEVNHDKEHQGIKIEVIVTLYKLIRQREPWGTGMPLKNITMVLTRLYEIFDMILDDTGVDLFADSELSRVDLIHDVVTPSQKYSREIISVLKTVNLPYGYSYVTPAIEQVTEDEWDIGEACLYNNKELGVSGKIYDKTLNITIGYDESFTRDLSLLRFELSLKKKFLKKELLLENDSVFDTLCDILLFAEHVYCEYCILLFDQGRMFSAPLMKKYIEMELGKKDAAIIKKSGILKLGERCRKNGEILTAELYPEGWSSFITLKGYFENLYVSMIPLSEEFPFIPSIHDLYYERCDPVLSKFVNKYTKGKEYCDE